MKIKAEHFEHIKTEVEKILAIHNSQGELVSAYESGEFSNSHKTKDLQRRFCADIAYGAGLSKFFCDVIYPYANDDHIYTAMKKVCPIVVRRY